MTAWKHAGCAEAFDVVAERLFALRSAQSVRLPFTCRSDAIRAAPRVRRGPQNPAGRGTGNGHEPAPRVVESANSAAAFCGAHRHEETRTVKHPVRSDLRWHKSFSSGSENCVEAAAVSDGVLVRDSKQVGDGPVLGFPAGGWNAFLGAQTVCRDTY
ncbi:MAG TPA: DUF397 domain-containing protein [Yinghuangia sp.]|uniref:DUF397 domain-containing protein n=1 Tax=Yinghuangia sp. YIM S10712 TaxID=3436930 RepID=UPI002CDF58E0|nr:DUF397 domain-containing protein [Yinghuangia sp.]